MDKFLSCDWGTSSFRLRLINVDNLQITAEEISDNGINYTFGLWKQSGQKSPEERLSFYSSEIYNHIKKLEVKLNLSLDHVPVFLSGMASSSIGMIDIPYSNLPFSISGTETNARFINANDDFKHDVLIISGVKSNNDVMRGEETQLIGLTENFNEMGDHIFIFPGTHSKHIRITDKNITDFETFMTGEFFELLSEKSILQSSVEKNKLESDDFISSFKQGVLDSLTYNLLHASFLTRTNSLFEKFTKSDNYHYLSGVLIGAELKELSKSSNANIWLCSGTKLNLFYETALQTLNFSNKVHIFPAHFIDQSVIKGQLKIYNLFKDK